MNENNKENLVLFIEDDQFDMNERLYDSIDEYAAET
jgi:uncharacterized metal-binding protein YceD (DUF177 family)